MYYEAEKIEKVKDALGKMANGINPISGEKIEGDGLLNDATMVRYFYFVTEVLGHLQKGNYYDRNRVTTFAITPEQKSRVVFPEHKIGVNEISRCINACLNPAESKRLTGAELNRRLKKLGVLSEEETEEGKKRTVINASSSQYGFETERKSYNGAEYDKIVINSEGKKYLMDNLEKIMAVEVLN